MAKKYFLLPILLAAISIVIAINNIVPGTWLTGWDNLHPEFNFPLNIGRSLSAVWQEYQGLGLVGGMAHAADLSRQLILWGASLVIPAQNLRYAWTFAMLILGPLGIYSLISLLAKGNKSNSSRFFGAFAGGIFYLLNLATVQSFFTPFETFTSFFGFFPWMLWGALSYLSKPSRRRLFLFALISALGASAFYVQTMFIVFVSILGIFLAEHLARNKAKGVKSAMKLLATLFAVHAFWLLPVIYFSITNIGVVGASKINSIATIETQLMNKGFGNIANIALLKGFWFNYLDMIQSNQFGYLMQSWRDYMANLAPQIAGYGLFALSSILILWRAARRKKWSIAILVSALVCFVMLSGIGLDLPLFSQMFRSPFTKWSVAFAGMLSLGIGMGIARFKNIFAMLAMAMVIGASAVVTKPVFEGNLIASSMRQEIPAEYFSLFEFLKTQPAHGRIVNVPMPTFWGWQFNEWGYRGSGFLWYGIRQPIMDRAFDVWSLPNEQFYRELSIAFADKKWDAAMQILQRYNVSFLLFDRSVISPGQVDVIETKDLESALKARGAEMVFEKDNLMVYRISQANTDALNAPSKIPEMDANFIFSDVTKENIDPDYEQQGNVTRVRFLAALSDKKEISIPELSAFEAMTSVAYDNDLVTIKMENPYQVELDGKRVSGASVPPFLVKLDKKYQRIYASVGGVIFEVENGRESVGKMVSIDTKTSLDVTIFNADNSLFIDTSDQFLSQQMSKCWEKEDGNPVLLTNRASDTINVTTKDVVGCMALKLGSFGNEKSLLTIALPYMSATGARPHFCVTEEGSDTCLTDDIFYHSNTSRIWSNVTRNIVTDAGKTYWLVVSARSSDDSNEQWEISYQRPVVTKLPQIAGVKFLPSVWNEISKQRTISTQNSKEISVEFTTVKTSFDIGTAGRSKAFNCDIKKRGEVTKQIEGVSVSYSANGYGASCDFSVLYPLTTRGEYALRFEGENSQGRGAKVYLFNKATGRNDLEYLLPQGKFDTSLALLPWSSAEANEYILNIETRSMGSENTKSTIDAVNAYPIPLVWLSSWVAQNGQIQSIDNVVTIANISSKGTFFYQADINSQKEDGVIILPQKFERGWIAFQGTKILPHFEAQGWANAWRVPLGESKITIIYLPQLIQFFGFGMAFLLTLGLIYPRIFKLLRN